MKETCVRRMVVWLLGCIAAVGLFPLQQGYAQGPRERHKPDWTGLQFPDSLPGAEQHRPAPASRSYAVLQDYFQSSSSSDESVTLIVELAQAPAVLTTERQTDATLTRARIAQVQSAQLSTLSAMATAGVSYRLAFSPTRVFSGLIIEADRGQIDTIRQIPGVTDVYPAGVGVIDNASSVLFLGTPDIWTTGYTGQGIRVAVIDTGIDYEHANFGGTGPGTGFPTVKVAGGYDFVGDSWHPDTNPVLVPDADPMDQQGHGTHMAGTIAGFGIDNGGNTYTGPWDNTTPFGSMVIGPGMAPEAILFALKTGANHEFISEAGTIMALEWAVDPDGDGDFSDRMDVINMSIGSGFGEANRGWTVAANNAARAGVIVVGAAVNYGDTYFMQGDPATGDWVISVGASDDSNNGGPAADTLGSFSARGPQRQPDPEQVALKPDIVAPGINIFSSIRGTLNGGVSGTGTSSATAHVSGMMALLREAYPGWSVPELKALVMNTATHDLYSGNNFTPPIYGPARVGAGRLDADQALDSEVIAYNTSDPELVSVSFGLLNVATASTWQKLISVENKGSTALAYDAQYVSVVHVDDNDGGVTPGIGNGGPGVTITITPPSITLDPGETETLTVTLSVDPAQLTRPFTHDPTVREIYPIYYRYWLAEEAGYVTLTPTTPDTALLRIPVYAAPRPSSTMSAASNRVLVSGISGTAGIPVEGGAVFTGPQQPYDETSLVSAFELLLTSPNQAGQSGFVESADIEHIGMASTYREQGGNLSTTEVYFGISTYGEWASLSEETRFEVYIDPDQNGVADYMLWNGTVAGTYFGFNSSDELFVFLDNLNTPSVPIDQIETFVNYYAPIGSRGFPNTVVFYNQVVFLPMYAAHIPELVPSDAEFDFWLASYYKDELVDLSDVMTYDIEAASIDLASGGTFWGATLYDDWDGATVDLNYDWSQYIGPDLPCILLLHHHNLPDTRAERVCLRTDLTSDLSITKAVSDPTPDLGDTITYTITASNDANVPAPMVIVEDILPDDVTYVSHTTSQGTYDPGTGQWIVGLLTESGTSGATAILEIVVTVDNNAAGAITNIASVRPNVGTEVTPWNNEATSTISLPGGPGNPAYFDPAMSKVGELQPGQTGLPGEQITWTITLVNHGTAAGVDIRVVDTLVPGLRVDGAATERGAYSIDGQTVTFSIDYLNPGEIVQMRIYTTVISIPDSGVFTNEARAFKADNTPLQNANGAVVAVANVTGVRMLPSTGYPPASDSSPNRLIWVGAAVLLGLILCGFAFWRGVRAVVTH